MKRGVFSKVHVVLQSLEIAVLIKNTFAEKLKSEPKATKEIKLTHILKHTVSV